MHPLLSQALPFGEAVTTFAMWEVSAAHHNILEPRDLLEYTGISPGIPLACGIQLAQALYFKVI